MTRIEPNSVVKWLAHSRSPKFKPQTRDCLSCLKFFIVFEVLADLSTKMAVFWVIAPDYILDYCTRLGRLRCHVVR